MSASHYVWWLASRSAGMVAMALVTASVLLGLAMAAKLIAPRRRKDALRLHEHLALLSLAAIGAHGLLLLPDPWLHPGASGIAVPFAIGYRPIWTGLGILAGYLAAALGLSFYVRRHTGPRLWRRLHRATALVYVLGLLHALGAGTDAQIPLVKGLLLASAAPALALMALRLRKERAWAMSRRSTREPASRKAIAWKPLPTRSASTTVP